MAHGCTGAWMRGLVGSTWHTTSWNFSASALQLPSAVPMATPPSALSTLAIMWHLRNIQMSQMREGEGGIRVCVCVWRRGGDEQREGEQQSRRLRGGTHPLLQTRRRQGSPSPLGTHTGVQSSVWRTQTPSSDSVLTT